jgi:hypothetical protein
MKYIKKYKLFESERLEELSYNELMGKLLHLYGSIPVPKEKSSIVIKKIVQASRSEFYKFGELVDINYCKVHDKIRFSDYFNSLLEQKDTRGHNFEGLICGLFGGDLSVRGSKWDVVVDVKKYSVKFVDNKSKAPEIGKFKNIIEPTDLDSAVEQSGGLTRLFKGNDMELKRQVWSLISRSIDGWILAYPDSIIETGEIIVNIVNKELMWQIISSGYVVAPKGGYKDFYSLALSSKYRNYEGIISSKIKIPKVSKEELVDEWRNVEEENWATKVFGDWGYKIRPDVLRYIKANKIDIIKKLSEI